MTIAGDRTKGSRRPPAQFDRVAHFYRWAEYLALGTLLRRTREQLLTDCTAARQVLVLGDGDGRFTAALLRQAPTLQAVAVDTSRKMLELLGRRCARQGDGGRVRLVHRSALDHKPAPGTDLIATHFFLDCLTQDEVEELAARLGKGVSKSCCWVISEFGLPERGITRIAAKAYIRVLYFAFRLLTGLRPQRLPDYRSALIAAGFTQLKQIRRVRGLLLSELWRLDRPRPEQGNVGTT